MNNLTPLQKRLSLAQARPSFLKDWKRFKPTRSMILDRDRVIDNTHEFSVKIGAKLHGLNNPQASKSNIS